MQRCGGWRRADEKQREKSAPHNPKNPGGNISNQKFKSTCFQLCHILLSHKISLSNYPVWRLYMETLSTILPLCDGKPPVTSGFLHKGRVMLIFDVFFVVSMSKLLNKQWTWLWFWYAVMHIWKCCLSTRYDTANSSWIQVHRLLMYPPWEKCPIKSLGMCIPAHNLVVSTHSP